MTCSSHILTKANSRWVTDLKVKETTLKSLENTGGKFSDPGIQPLDLAPKLKELKKKKRWTEPNQELYPKLLLRETVKEKTLRKYFSTIYKELLKFTSPK